MITCFIIDDEPAGINILKRYIAQLPHLQLLGAETNPRIAVEIIKKQKPAIVFLDLEMSEMNGIEVIKEIGTQTNVILCSAYSERSLAHLKLNVPAWLTKPIELSNFTEAVNAVLKVNN